ncbi:ATP-binding protein [Mycobacterium sp. KBS0706]|uniref:ATP-binding protein n=1 Tax=Mycobacterium sp. KBS0706 TaxID=2578109 RepID=UPI00110FAD72|nr:ATP-binding protein [Mycobacterium sp. KBS0706]TSD87528.1 ATP-binding protein [Mycobacterium sp. KBS0706]
MRPGSSPHLRDLVPTPAGRCAVPALVQEWLDRDDLHARKPPVVAQLLAWHRINVPGGEHAIILKNASLLPRILDYENARQAARGAAGHPHRRILDLEPLPSPIPHMRFDPSRVRIGRGWRLQYKGMQGSFRLRLTDSHQIFLIAWGPTAKTTEMAIGTRAAFELLYERLETRRRRLQVNAPKRGLWRLDDTEVGNRRVTFFEPAALDAPSALRFASHPAYPVLETDLLDFFGNIGWWTRYSQPGMRKVLMAGPPGTGKTSIALALAAKLHPGFLVVQARDSVDVVHAAERAAAAGRATIILAEEIDMFRRPDGEALNWLDGSATPRNPSGTYLIATTNYPRSIDPRILQRPGRIDRIFRVGALRTRAAGDVAISYLGEDAANLSARELGQVLDRTTPAEVREIINLALRSLPPGTPLSPQHLAETRSALKQSLAGAVDLGDDDPESRERLHDQLGPIDEEA